MKKFIIENDFWEVFPDMKIGSVLCRNIDNSIGSVDKYADMLRTAETMAKCHITNEEFSKNSAISVWREAFKEFKTKKGARSSIEALLKRVKNGNQIGNINPLVDIYNSISLKYAFPCGGEDIDTFSGNLRLTKALGDEEFVTLGSDKSAPPFPGEIVYKDDIGAVCRCFNWRESVRTMLTEDTTNAFLCIELMDPSRLDDLESALDELSSIVQECLGGECSISILDYDNKEILLD